MLLLMAILVVACEPETKIVFENNQTLEITIYVAHVRDDGTIDELKDYGKIPPNSNKAIFITFLGNDWVNRIQARIPNGDVVLSHDFTREELEKQNWSVTIGP